MVLISNKEMERINDFWEKTHGICTKCGTYNGWSNSSCRECGDKV